MADHIQGAAMSVARKRCHRHHLLLGMGSGWTSLPHGRRGLVLGDRGATAAEYALMASLIAVAIIGAVSLFGQNVIPLFSVPASAL
jgi:Flp pilus assembly pilin Flp